MTGVHVLDNMSMSGATDCNDDLNILLRGFSLNPHEQSRYCVPDCACTSTRAFKPSTQRMQMNKVRGHGPDPDSSILRRRRLLHGLALGNLSKPVCAPRRVSA